MPLPPLLHANHEEGLKGRAHVEGFMQVDLQTLQSSSEYREYSKLGQRCGRTHTHTSQEALTRACATLPGPAQALPRDRHVCPPPTPPPK